MRRRNSPKSGIVARLLTGLGLRKLRGEMLGALAEWDPEIVALGASRISVTAVLHPEQLDTAVRGLHGRFFEEAHA